METSLQHRFGVRVFRGQIEERPTVKTDRSERPFLVFTTAPGAGESDGTAQRGQTSRRIGGADTAGSTRAPRSSMRVTRASALTFRAA
jgi:hypothetical protein